VTASDQPELLAYAKAAVAAGAVASTEYHQAAARAPGTGVAVALPSDPAPSTIGPPRGLNFNLAASVPAIRPTPPADTMPMAVADPVVGGETYLRPGGLLDGVRTASERSGSIVYLSASAPRPTLATRVRGEWRALRGR
jgi:hypothetical protein